MAVNNINTITSEAVAVDQLKMLAHYHAYRYRNWGVPFEDLVQEGLIGIVEAFRLWRSEGGCSLATLASMYIRSRMRRSIGRQDGKLRPPRRDRSMDRGGESAVGDVHAGDKTLHELIGTPATQEDDLADAERTAAVYVAIDGLGEREREIMYMRLAGLSLRAIELKTGQSKSRVLEIEEEATNTLRARLGAYRDET